MSKVSIIKCPSYEDEKLLERVEEAVASVVDLAQLLKPGSKVLLKPNILYGAEPERAVTTHPLIIRAVASLVNKYGGEIWIGDSSGFGSTKRNLQKCGVPEVLEGIDYKIVPFTNPVEVHVPDGKHSRTFNIERAVLEADVIINIPKLKTHGLTYFTGAVKNLYGCIPGLDKGKGHMKMPSRELFSHLLVDLNRAVKPQLTVMDAIIGMEGAGPGSGDPRHIGLILAGTDNFALDSVACSIIGLNPQSVLYLAYAREEGVGCADMERIEIVGEQIEDVKITDFKMAVQSERPKKLRNKLLGIVGRLLKPVMLERPVLIPDKCKKCKICAEVCPVKTIEMDKQGPVFNYENCIYCYCCQELCPAGAIKLRRKLFLSK